MNFRLNNNIYDILQSVSRWLYAVGIFYLALGTLLAAILEKSTVNYLKNKEGR